MSKLSAFVLNPRLNFSGAVLSTLGQVWSWFTTLDDPYKVTPIAFVLTVYFLVMLAAREHSEAEQLRAAAQPKLTLLYGTGQNYDSLHHSDTLRIFRIGVVNSGESVSNVEVKVARIKPQLPRVFPMQALNQMHQKDGVSRFTVNKSTELFEPLVYVDFVYQSLHASDGQSGHQIGNQPTVWKYHRKGETSRMWFKFAAGEREIPRDSDQYLIWLAIDGPGAGKQLKVVLQRNVAGQYDMAEAFS